MNASVLGATGQLGANVVRPLLQKGHRVRAFRRKTSRMIGLPGLSVEVAEGDLMDPESIRRALQGCDALLHTGPYYPSTAIPVQQAVTAGLADVRNVMEAARHVGVRRIVYTSTLTTIGMPPTAGALANEACAVRSSFPKNPYLVAKAAMEDEVSLYYRDSRRTLHRRSRMEPPPLARVAR